MVDRQFFEDDLAELYDVLHPWEERDDLEQSRRYRSTAATPAR